MNGFMNKNHLAPEWNTHDEWEKLSDVKLRELRYTLSHMWRQHTEAS